MLRAGVFDDVAAAVMVHPGPTDIAAARSLALSEAIVHYRGKESHAAVAPHLGVNAADAVTVAQVAIGLLRQQLAPGQLVHGIVTDGGQAVNVIPGHATSAVRDAGVRIGFAATSWRAGCSRALPRARWPPAANTKSTTPAPPYAELTPDPWLADVFREEMRRLGREPVAPEVEAGLPMGSTDMGNVTQVLPGIHPVIGVDAGGATVHQRAFAAAAAGPSADRAVVDGAIMLARTVVHLAQTPAERDRVMAAQRDAAGHKHEPRRRPPNRGWPRTHDDLVEWRRHIHRYPELGRQEYATTQFVAERLADAGLNPKVLPGGTGLICDLGPEHEPRIALRADIDALPMAERTGAPYASTMPNVAHACGHDAHTAILLGTALALASVPELPVGVRLIFQAAEELMPGGAIDAIAAGAITGVSRIFALHCDPRLAVGKVAVRQGPITSAADSIEITLYSPGGHTSRPHLTADLVYGLGTLITGLPGVLSRRIDPRNGTVLVWGAVNAGVAANAIPQTGVLAGTVRTASRQTWVGLEEIIRQAVSALLSPLAIEHTLQLPARRAAGGQRGRLDPHPHPRDRSRRPGGAGRYPAVRRRRGLLLVLGGDSRRDGATGRVVGRGTAVGPAPADVRPRRTGPGDRAARDGQHHRAVGRVRAALALAEELGAGTRTDVAGRASPQVVYVIRWRTGDFGGVGHHAQVARRGQAALPGVQHVQPSQYRVGGGVRG